MSITEFQIIDKPPESPWRERLRNLLASETTLFVFFIVFVSLSFFLGYLSGKEEGGEEAQKGVVITTPSTPSAATLSLPSRTRMSDTDTLLEGQEVVASKNGTRYYFPWCGGVSRIKPENLVSFPSEEAAQLAGLSLASGCN